VQGERQLKARGVLVARSVSSTLNSAALFTLALVLVPCACSGSTSSEAGVAPDTPDRPAPDPQAITKITGGSPEVLASVVKVSFPRTDVAVQIDGWSNVPPFMGLTSYASFMSIDGGNAMVMGDLVLFEDEVNRVMGAALDAGLGVTALHNHFFFTKPAVYFMHIGGTGPLDHVAVGVRAALEAVKAVRRGASAPRASFGPPVIGRSRIDSSKLDAVLGTKGKAQAGMYKATFGRTVHDAMCGGCTVGSAMGINTWAGFAGTDDDAVVDGDFAVTEDELRVVLIALRDGGINVVAIHAHTMDESPPIIFLHYWGRGSATVLAATVRSAVDRTGE
jgi:hypothetical protein